MSPRPLTPTCTGQSPIALVVAAIGLAALTPDAAVARPPSFDCAKASTPIERMICADPSLAALDADLALTYIAALGRLPEEYRESFREEQRQWVDMVQQWCAGDELRFLRTCISGEYVGRKRALATVIVSYGDIQVRQVNVFDVKAITSDNTQKPYARLMISYPQIEGVPSDSLRLLNQILVDKANASISYFKTEDNKDNSDIELDYEIHLLSAKLMSIELIDTFYSPGGAHAGGDISIVNWLLKDGRALRPADLFADDKRSRKFITDYCVAQLNYQRDAGDVFKIVNNPERWGLWKNGLVIQFNPQEIGPYTAGVEEVTIPWQNLRKFLTLEADTLLFE